MYFSTFTQEASIAADGGKGYNLKVLTQNGFSVPEGTVLCASFYRDCYPMPPDFKYGNEAVFDGQCLEMYKKVLEQQLPAACLKELDEFLLSFDSSTMFAVRSSSTLEDLAGASFAGQHDSFLHVPPDKVEENVQKCLASLWKKHAVLYRNHQGFTQNQASMAVVIQRMIPGDRAGVAFSVDPVSGILSHVLIEANFGIGESVVGGEAITDSWVVDSSSWEIIEARINEKEYALVPAAEGIIRKDLTEAEKTKASLSDDEVIEVAQECKKLMSLYNAPQDIEWVYHKKNLYILQSRPQTAIPARFTRDESAERFPDPLTPLTWSYVKEAFNNSLEYSLHLMDLKLPTRPWFDLKEQYVYGNQNAVELLALCCPVPARNYDELIPMIPQLKKKFQWVMTFPDRWMSELDNYLIGIGRLQRCTLEDFSCIEFQGYSKDLFKLANDYFRPNIAISMTQAFLTRSLGQIISFTTPDELKAHELLKKIISVADTKTSQINREILVLAGDVRDIKSLQKLLSQGGKAAFKELECFPDFCEKFKKFINDYGHREISFDYYYPTWIEAPEIVLDLISLATSSRHQVNSQEKESGLRKQQMAATQQLYEKTPVEAHFFLHELIRLTIHFTFLDDLEHFQTTRMNSLVRRAIKSFGTKMNDLEDPYDLFFLEKNEIEQIKDFRLSDKLLKTIKERKRKFIKAQKQEPPWDFDSTSKGDFIDGSILQGIPGSPGESQGEVYIIKGPADFAGMTQGAILVSKTTNPSWTPLFYNASAIITESGGPLSHGAVTARELGLPAVMCVKNCLSLLNNGEKVYVDGQKGVVKKIKT
jgi:pyruvate,water dikinase